jgi:hypothetical protein
MAYAFASAGGEPDKSRFWPGQAEYKLDTLIEEVRNLQSSDEDPLFRAWFTLRASLAMEDAELLAAADILAGWVSPGWDKQAVVAKIAQARSDDWAERQAIEKFMEAAELVEDESKAFTTILTAAEILTGSTSRNTDTTVLAGWASRRLERFRVATFPSGAAPSVVEALPVLAALSLAKSKTIAIPTWLIAQLDLLYKTQEGSVWLWALAYDIFADQRYKALALAAKRPKDLMAQGFALLRMHQITGDMHWVSAVQRLVRRYRKCKFSDRQIALLTVESNAPEKATFPFFLLPALMTDLN